MFNVTVLKMRDIVKYLVSFIIIMFIIIYATRYFSSLSQKSIQKEDKNKLSFTIFNNIDTTKFLDHQIVGIKDIDEEEHTKENSQDKVSYLEKFMQTEIIAMREMENVENKQNELANNEEQKNIEKPETSNDTNLNKVNIEKAQTEVVTPNPIKESYNVQYNNVKIKNETSYTLTQEMMTPDISLDNKNIIIFHTHSCESYTPSDKYNYSSTGNFRTTDLNFTVTRVGTELQNYLKLYNHNVIHDTSYHDYPSYSGSYTRSLQTVENILKDNQSDIIIDLHRDAIGSRSDYAPTVKIGEDYVAQIMFVIGTNDGGLWHPNWNQNLKFAIKIQERAEEMYPGLFKPIMLTTSRYNQHTGKYANIMEVGATGNTLEQCLTSMKYLSAVINSVFSE